ncbi:DNA polymerase III subunit delta [Oscillospiraceae bacterium HV4-5-C5C]|nr:DNA polymerase III subunit delta [Oscillospiraceae bacterium HV4-5-C5C]
MASRKNSSSQAVYEQLTDELTRQVLRPVYLIYGDEVYLQQELINRIRLLALDPQMADLDFLTMDLEGYASRLDLNKLTGQLQTPPFLSPRRLILLRRSHYFTTPRPADELQKQLRQMVLAIPSSSCLIFWEDKVDLRSKLLPQAIGTAGGLTAEINKLDVYTLEKKLGQLAKQAGFRLTAEASDSLIYRCDSDMAALSNEMKKLALYMQWKQLKTADINLIETVCCPDQRGSIFDLTAALSKGDTTGALMIMQTLRLQKEPIQLMLLMLSRHFRQLICAREWSEREIIEHLRVPPFVAARLKKQAAAFNYNKLAALYEACFRTDRDIKSGKIEDGLGFELLITQAGRLAASQSL